MLRSKILIPILLFLLVILLAIAAIETLNVQTCSGVTCSVAGLNSDDALQDGATIGKNGQLVTGTWTDTTFPASSTIDDVDFVITHSGDTGIGGTLTIDFRNEADTASYCTFNVNNVVSSTKETIDTDASCTWTQAELNDLRVEITNNEPGSPQNAYISFLDIVITYTPPDTTPPTITLNAPANRSWDFDTNILFNYTPSDDRSLSNCSIYIDGALNQTNLSPTNASQNSFLITGFSDGNHTWRVSCFDATGNLGNSTTRQVRIDTQAPIVNLESPADFNVSSVSTINFFYNATDAQTNLASCELIIDGQSVTSTSSPQERTSLSFQRSFANGVYLWQVNCTDTNGYEATSAQRTITISTVEPTIFAQAASYDLGEVVIVEGENWGALTNLTINYTLSNGTIISHSIITNTAGNASDQLYLGYDYPTGSYTIYAYETLDPTQNASDTFTANLLSSTITMGQATYAQGDTIQITGSDFPKNASINLTLNFTGPTSTSFTTTANNAGSFTITYQLGYSAPIGQANVTARDLNYSRYNATTNFDIIQRIVLLTTDLLVYGFNDDVMFEGFNFTRNGTIQVAIYDNETDDIGSSFPINYTANNAGYFTNLWNTDNTCNGIYRIEAIDQNNSFFNDTHYFTINEIIPINAFSTPSSGTRSTGGAITLSNVNSSNEVDETQSLGGGSGTVSYTFNFTELFNNNVQISSVVWIIEHAETVGFTNPSISYFNGSQFVGISCADLNAGTTDHTDLCNITSALSSSQSFNPATLRFTLTKSGGGTETSNIDFTALNISAGYQPVCTYFNGSVGGGLSGNPPFFTTILLEDGLATPANQLDLNAGATRTIFCNTTISDADGFSDIQSVNATIYRTSVGASAPDNNTNHYSSSCSFVAGNGNLANYTCQFQVQYYAVNGSWTCQASVTDGSNQAQGFDTATMNPLYAINITPQLIDYGILTEGQVSSEYTANLTNIGNTPLGVEILGYAIDFGDNLSFICPQENLSIELQRFSSSSTPYGAKTALSANYQDLGINLYPTQNGTLRYNQSYWQLQVMGDEPSGVCNGTIVFQATP